MIFELGIVFLGVTVAQTVEIGIMGFRTHELIKLIAGAIYTNG